LRQNYIIALGLFALLASCSPAVVKPELSPAPPNSKSDLNSAQAELSKGHDKLAAAKLKKLATLNPGTDVYDTASTLLGRIYLNRHDYKMAYTYYAQSLTMKAQTAHEEEASVGACKALVQLGRVDEALALSSRALDLKDLSKTSRVELEKLRIPLLKETGDAMAALRSIAFVFNNVPDSSQRESLRNKGYEITNKLARNELENVIANDVYSFARGFAAYRLGMYFIEQHQSDHAIEMFAKTQALSPDTSIAEQATSQIQQLEGRRKVDPFAIGAIVPLSGHYSSIGQKTLHGLQLGLGIYGPQPRSKFKLAVLDSEGSPDEAKNAVDTLVTDDHVIAIAGSILSRTSSAVASRANELGVPSISLSQKAGITESGSLVFRNAVTSAMQVQQLVKTAMDDLGMKRFAILFPNDQYGVEYANLFWEEVQKKHGIIVSAQPYNTTETDFRAPVKRLVGTYYLEDREKEYKKRLQDWFHEQKVPRGGRSSPPDDLLPPIVDFDGLFVADGPKSMGQIAPMLAYVGVTNVHFLGTNLWNTPEFLRRGQKHVENALFVDAQVTTDPRFQNSKFYTDFKQTFGTEPGMFELQGYETGLLMSRAITAGEITRIGLAEKIGSAEPVMGVLGPLQMTQDRELVWPITAFTVENGTIIPFAKKESGKMTK
jgi:ABC-type branched-subunit amino acid transport system substrate-binding protein